MKRVAVAQCAKDAFLRENHPNIRVNEGREDVILLAKLWGLGLPVHHRVGNFDATFAHDDDDDACSCEAGEESTHESSIIELCSTLFVAHPR